MIRLGDHTVALRWLGVALMAGSLLVLAGLPGAVGLAGAALCWIVAFLLFEVKPRRHHRD